MSRHVAFCTVLSVLLSVGLLAFALDIQTVRANGVIYIRSDGSVDPPIALIQRDGDEYTFTGNITDEMITIERGNIVVNGNGYTLEGSGGGLGLYVNSVDNVTIKRTNIVGFGAGIELNSASHITISEDRISGSDLVFGILIESSNSSNIYYNEIVGANRSGIVLFSSSDDNIIKNEISESGWSGIDLEGSSGNSIIKNEISGSKEGFGIEIISSSYNRIIGNNITDNYADGIFLQYSVNNSIGQNSLANNYRGISLLDSSSNNRIVGNSVVDSEKIGLTLDGSSDNLVYHNNFVNNTLQIYIYASPDNVMDNGYPSGGNYWSELPNLDSCRGPFQNETGSDGFCDYPYSIGREDVDRYPLVTPYVPILSDLNTDGKVDILDIAIVAKVYGSRREDTDWNVVADVNDDRIINILDMALIAKDYGKTV